MVSTFGSSGISWGVCVIVDLRPLVFIIICSISGGSLFPEPIVGTLPPLNASANTIISWPERNTSIEGTSLSLLFVRRWFTHANSVFARMMSEWSGEESWERLENISSREEDLGAPTHSLAEKEERGRDEKPRRKEGDGEEDSNTTTRG